MDRRYTFKCDTLTEHANSDLAKAKLGFCKVMGHMKALVRNENPSGPAELVNDMNEVCLMFAGIQQHIDEQHLHFASLISERRHIYDGATILGAFLLANNLKQLTRDKLERALVHALRLIVPRSCEEEVLEKAKEVAKQCPSSATLQRARFRLEVAWWCYWRWWFFNELRSGAGLLMYNGIDGSPMATVNYEIFQSRIVRRDELPEIHTLIVTLRSMAETLDNDERLEFLTGMQLG